MKSLLSAFLVLFSVTALAEEYQFYSPAKGHKAVAALRSAGRSKDCDIKVSSSGKNTVVSIQSAGADKNKFSFEFTLDDVYGTAPGVVSIGGKKYPSSGHLMTGADSEYSFEAGFDLDIDQSKVYSFLSIHLVHGHVEKAVVAQRFVDRCMPGYYCATHRPKLSAFTCNF
jgi:opacity protein-like surface antigen